MDENNVNNLNGLRNLQSPQGPSPMPDQPVLQTGEGGQSLGRYTAKTFLWMFAGLMVTFLISIVGYIFYLPIRIYMIHPSAIYVITGLELVVVLVLSAKLSTLPVMAARALFFVYAALNGVVFSTYFFLFEVGSLVLVFAVTAAYFGVMAAFGYFTSMDLSRIRTILISGLIFLVIFGIVSMFIPVFGLMEQVVCIIGIVVFLGFTAYDTQKIKSLYYGLAGDEAMLAKASIYSALQLYLDFINLFLYLLRFLGKRRN